MNFLSTATSTPTSPTLDLHDLRRVLIRLEDTIIFAIIERAQFPLNAVIYDPQSPMFSESLHGQSFVEWLLHQVECVHAKVRRYTSPDEYPFSAPDSLPPPILAPLAYHSPLKEYARINLNRDLYEVYVRKVVPRICARSGLQDLNYGSSATRDVELLQALSKRIHYGCFIAEAKFRESTEKYTRLINARDAEGLLRALTNEEVERQLLTRLRRKAELYGRDITTHDDKDEKISPEAVVALYRDYVIPLTKRVEVAYLLRRLGEALMLTKPPNELVV